MPRFGNNLAGDNSPIVRRPRTTPVIVQVGANSTYTISGPAAGCIRILSHRPVAVPLGASCTWTTTLISASLSQVFGRAIAGGNATGVTSAIGFNNGFAALAYGETITVENTGAAAGELSFSYYDISAAGITAVRKQLSGTGKVPIIPAAPSGQKNVLLQGWGQHSMVTAEGYQPIYLSVNDDTAAIQVEAFLDTTCIARSSSASASFQFSFTPNLGLLEITTQPLQLALLASVAARPANVALMYKTVPIQAA